MVQPVLLSPGPVSLILGVVCMFLLLVCYMYVQVGFCFVGESCKGLSGSHLLSCVLLTLCFKQCALHSLLIKSA